MNLAGTGVALATPFDQQLQVDYEGLGRLLAHTAGVDYWVVHGTTGESATTTREEKAQILEFIKQNNPTGKPIVYGLGGNNTRYLLEELKKINFDGVSGLLSVCPYYNKPTQEGLYQHFDQIANASPVPVILYNVPSRTASNLEAVTTLRLAKHAKIIGIKEAASNLEQGMTIAKYAPYDFQLVSGDDLMTLPLISVGATGVISVLANAKPEILSAMVNAALAGDLKKSQENLFRFLELNPLMYREANPVGVKEVLKVLGICGNYVRLPLLPASEELQKEIKERLNF